MNAPSIEIVSTQIEPYDEPHNGAKGHVDVEFRAATTGDTTVLAGKLRLYYLRADITVSQLSDSSSNRARALVTHMIQAQACHPEDLAELWR